MTSLAIAASDGYQEIVAREIEAVVDHTEEMLEIRDSSDLWRLTTAGDVQDRVGFHNTGPGQLPGLIVMSISDVVGDDLDDLVVGELGLADPPEPGPATAALAGTPAGAMSAC